MTRAAIHAVWTAVCLASVALMLSRAVVRALAGDYLLTAWFTAAAVSWLLWARSARRRWKVAVQFASYRAAMAQMRHTRRCAPPGHMWGPYSPGVVLEPGWCICGEEYRNQSECDALNGWRCEP